MGAISEGQVNIIFIPLVNSDKYTEEDGKWIAKIGLEEIIIGNGLLEYFHWMNPEDIEPPDEDGDEDDPLIEYRCIEFGNVVPLHIYESEFKKVLHGLWEHKMSNGMLQFYKKKWCREVNS
ncbi:hypothetical protein DX910_01475 [Acinetobacter haemolyticus]|nr:hypothetical protein DX910_01475 [Acinetobacter haemolyticus]